METPYHHERSPLAVLLIAIVVLGLVSLVPRVPSQAAAVGAGIAAGGAIANLVSALAWQGGVPDPLVLGGVGGGVAFNLADVFALSGDAVLLTAALLYATRRRTAMGQPV